MYKYCIKLYVYIPKCLIDIRSPPIAAWRKAGVQSINTEHIPPGNGGSSVRGKFSSLIKFVEINKFVEAHPVECEDMVDNVRSAKGNKLYEFGKHGMLLNSGFCQHRTELYADAQSAERYWNHFKRLSFGKKLTEYYHMGMAIVDCINTWKQKENLFHQAAVDAKQYDKDVKSGKLQGKQREWQKADVFAQYAKALNDRECWIGKLALLDCYCGC